MAKRDDDDLDDIEEAAEEAAEADEVEDADEDVEEAAEDADEADDDDADDAGEDEDDDGADDGDDADEEEAEEEQPSRKAKITGLTLTLIILNVLAALGFVFLLIQDFGTRQKHTWSGVEHEAALFGSGTTDEHKAQTPDIGAPPQPRISADEIKDAMKNRGAKAGSEALAGVDQGLQHGIFSAGVGEAARKELLKDLNPPVASIEEEFGRLKTALLSEIENTGKSMVEALKGDDAKRDRVRLLLMPLAVATFQIDALDKHIAAAQGEALDTLLNEATQRRLIADILNPVEMFRPGDIDAPNSFIEKVADLDALKLDDVKNLLVARLDNAAKEKYDGNLHLSKEWDSQPRMTHEKRQNAAFLLVSIAYARKHLDDKAKLEEQLLFPQGLVRAQRIVGLYDFAAACRQFTQALRRLEERVQTALVTEREGFSVEAGNQVKRGEGFADRQTTAVRRIQDVQLDIGRAEERKKTLEVQLAGAQKLLAEREAHTKDLAERINKARGDTRVLAGELRLLQRQKFEADKKLADAAEINLRLLRDIEELTSGKRKQP
jgi:hypothetical protein